jgi:hypothetical protein
MNQILDYANRIRTIEEVAQLLKASLGIRMLKGRRDLWQVKLEKVEILGSNPLEHKYAFVRHSNPNVALNVLCVRLSHATVRINNTKYRLGEVKREPFYIRLYDDKSTLV